MNKRNSSKNDFVVWPWISYLFRYSGFLPLKVDFYDNVKPISLPILVVAIVFLVLNVLSLSVSIIEMLSHLKDGMTGSLLFIFRSVHIILILQGVSMVCSSMLLCLSLYWSLIEIRTGDSISMFFPTLMVLLQIIRLTTLASEGSNFQCESNSLLLDAEKLDVSLLNPDMMYQLKSIFIREGVDPVYLSATKFFAISKSLLLSILGAVFTCVVVFVQMAPDKSSCGE
ncbi:uncharacterized protein LOC129218967 [Uloborus diversus]|uniref:uncharacterized protein LOC129218967 n=1 Tax=Uloborus diversus TaxID=327109 RepID=UPI00240A64C8|nr:uncharacterized protein LOC129218967 [Uloborus diversus]